MTKARKSYPSDVSDEEWAFCAPYLTLMKEDAPQREHSLRELYNGLRWFVRAGCPWRMMPNDLPPGTRRAATNPALAAGGLLCNDGRRFTGIAAAGRATRQRPDGGDRGQSHVAIHAGEWAAPVTTWAKNARAARCMRWWTRWAIYWRSKSRRPTNRIGRRSKPWHKRSRRRRGKRATGVCGSRLHRRATGRGRGATRNEVGSREAFRSQTRLCAAATPLGGGTDVCLGRTFSATGARLRTPRYHPGYHWLALAMLMLKLVFAKSA